MLLSKSWAVVAEPDARGLEKGVGPVGDVGERALEPIGLRLGFNGVIGLGREEGKTVGMAMGAGTAEALYVNLSKNVFGVFEEKSVPRVDDLVIVIH
jgi:hypothetical protein